MIVAILLSATIPGIYSSENTKNAVPPTPPRNLQANPGNGYITLRWDPPADDGGSAITNYRIYKSTSSGGERYLTQVGASTTTYTDSSVSKGITYYYYVTAVNSVGESQPSNEVNATSRNNATKPTPPRNLQANAGNGYIYLSWDIPANYGDSAIIEYKIYRGDSSGNEVFFTSVSGNTTSYTDRNVANGKTYYYYVTAVNSAGESQPSNEVHSHSGTDYTWFILLGGIIAATVVIVILSLRKKRFSQ